MPLVIPPHVTPPKSVRKTLALLRQSGECIIATWPETMYREPFHQSPVKSVIYVMEPEAIEQILVSQSEKFAHSRLVRRILRPIWRSGLTTSTGESWRWQRRAAAPAFTPQAVETIVPSATRAGHVVARSWLEQRSGTADVTLALGNATQQVVLDCLLGDLIDATTGAALLDQGAQLVREMNRINYADLLMLPNWTRRFLGPTFHATAGRMHRKIAMRLEHLDQSGSANAPMLERLAQSCDPDTGKIMPVSMLRDNIVGSIAAGRETTALAIAWALMLLALDPDAQQQLFEEVREIETFTPDALAGMTYTRAVLLEAMRLYPPAPQIVRDCLEDTELNGRKIRKGTIVNLPIYAIHRHHALWDNPDAFDPERFLKQPLTPRELRKRYLPFGGGARVCLGQAFALTEASILIAILVQKLRFELPNPEHIAFETGASLRPKGGLHLHFTPRG